MLDKDTQEVENIKIIDFGFSNYLSKLLEKRDSEGKPLVTKTCWPAPPTTSLQRSSRRSSLTSRSTTSPSESSFTSCTPQCN